MINDSQCHPLETEFNEEDGLVYGYCEACYPDGAIQAFGPTTGRISHLVETGKCHSMAWTPKEGVQLNWGIDRKVWG